MTSRRICAAECPVLEASFPISNHDEGSKQCWRRRTSPPSAGRTSTSSSGPMRRAGPRQTFANTFLESEDFFKLHMVDCLCLCPSFSLSLSRAQRLLFTAIAFHGAKPRAPSRPCRTRHILPGALAAPGGHLGRCPHLRGIHEAPGTFHFRCACSSRISLAHEGAGTKRDAGIETDDARPWLTGAANTANLSLMLQLPGRSSPRT